MYADAYTCSWQRRRGFFVALSLGDYLEQELARRGISKADLARRTGLPRVTIGKIAKGRTGISVEVALKLEDALGIRAEEWLSRQNDDRLAEARARRRRRK